MCQMITRIVQETAKGFWNLTSSAEWNSLNQISLMGLEKTP